MQSIIPAAPRLVQEPAAGHPAASLIRLPDPIAAGKLSVVSALCSRCSVRDFARQPLTHATVSQLLAAAQAVTGTEQPWCILPVGRIKQLAQ